MPSVRRRPPTFLIMLLDLGAIVCVAVAMVLLLGGRQWFYVRGLWVLLPDAPQLFVFAALSTILRYWIARDVPILPSLHLQNIQPDLDAERERFAHPPPVTWEVRAYALAAATASLVWVTPHIFHIRDVPDPGDPVFSAWRLARFGHQLLHQPTRLFDGNIFHPARDTLTYSDPTVLEGLVALPFIAAGADPLIVSNGLFLASFPLAALAFFWAGWRLTSDPRAGCVAGVLGGLSSFKIEHYSHLELQFFWFAPLAVVALMRLLAAPSWRTGGLLGAVLTAQWLACMYFGVMLLVFLAPFAVLLAVAWRIRPTRKVAVAVATTSAIVILGGSITAVPFARSQGDRGDRIVEEVRVGSALPSDYVASHDRLVTYRAVLPRSQNERELFPGTVSLVLAAAGAMPPLSLGTIILVAGTAVAFDGSLGLNGLIYDDLYTHAVPFRGMRVPARFAAFVSSGLILLSAYGARRLFLLGRTRRAQFVLFAVLAAAAMVDLRSEVRLERYFATVPPIYSAVTPDMVLLELPMHVEPSVAYMYFSTSHGARLINGQSGNEPADYGQLEQDLEHFPTTPLIERLRQRGATHVTVNCRLFSDPLRCETVLGAMDRTPELVQISSATWESFEVRLYKLR